MQNGSHLPCPPCVTQTQPHHAEPPDSKVHGANMGPIWGRQDPGGPHVGPMNIAISAGWPQPSLEAFQGELLWGHKVMAEILQATFLKVFSQI